MSYGAKAITSYVFQDGVGAILDFVTTMIPNSTITIPVDFVMAEIVGNYTSLFPLGHLVPYSYYNS